MSAVFDSANARAIVHYLQDYSAIGLMPSPNCYLREESWPLEDQKYIQVFWMRYETQPLGGAAQHNILTFAPTWFSVVRNLKRESRCKRNELDESGKKL